MTIDLPNPQAMFGCVYNASISNLYLENINFAIESWNVLAGLVGIAENSFITNCSVTGSLTNRGDGDSGFISGLAGELTNSQVRRCSSNVYCTGDLQVEVSGLLGSCHNCIIDNSYSNCVFESTDAEGNPVYSGFCRSLSGTSSVTNCYSSCRIDGFGSMSRRGFNVIASVGVVISGCYYDYEKMDVALVVDNDGVAAMSRTTVQMATKANYVEWSFNPTYWEYGATPWYFSNNSGVNTPLLKPYTVGT